MNASSTRTRHRRATPCPVCGGGDDMQRGAGTRCHGWTSGDGDYAHCSREERAGGLEQEAGGTFAHRLTGPCRCGQTHGGATVPLQENRITVRDTRHYEIRSAAGELVATHVRRDMSDGGKRFSWSTPSCATGLNGFPVRDLPLYRLPEMLATDPDQPVVLVEGERACDALRALGVCSVGTVTGASLTPSKAALQPLSGRSVYLWPDHDDVGRAHMERVAGVLGQLGVQAHVIQWTDARRDGDDAADFIARGGTLDGARELLAAARPWTGDAGGASLNGHDDHSREPGSDDGDEPAPQPRAMIEAHWRPVGDLLDTEAPPEHWLLRHPTHNGKSCPPHQGDGFLPRGEAGCLSAPGGTGKTMAVLQLAVALVTGRRWLGHYDVTPAAERGRVLLVLGEESLQRAHRRLQRLARALQLDAEERQAVARDVVIVPLGGAGPCPLLAREGQAIFETKEMAALRRLLVSDAGARGWSLLVVDPQARFAGVEVESDNLLATQWVQVIETLTRVPGSPTALVVGHSSKAATVAGKADARGVTGQADAFRWHSTLFGRSGKVLFSVQKNNYGRPSADLELVRGEDGILHALSSEQSQAERTAAAAAEEARKVEERHAALERDIGRVLAAVAGSRGGVVHSKADIAATAGLRKARAMEVVDVAVSRHRLCLGGTSRAPAYRVRSDGPCTCAAGTRATGEVR